MEVRKKNISLKQASASSFGRPQDDPFENAFMERLKNGKLHEISAESEVELASCSLEKSKKELKKGQDRSQEKLGEVRAMFADKDPEKFEGLWRCFEEGRGSWQPPEVNSVEDFGQYLFMDYADLSYIMQQAILTLGQRYQSSFTGEELLFMEMISLGHRDMISFRLINSIKHHYDDIVVFLNPICCDMLYQQHITNKTKPEYNQEMQEKLQSRKEGHENYLNINFEQVNQREAVRLFKEVEQQPEQECEPKKGQKSKKIKKEKKDKKPKEKELFTLNELQGLLNKIYSHAQSAFRYILPTLRHPKQAQQQFFEEKPSRQIDEE